MSKEHNISNFEQILKEQFSSAKVPAPEGVWDVLEANLDSLQADIQFDQGLREGAENANITPPNQVWQGVQQGMGWANGGGFWASLAAKIIIGIGSAALITTSVVLLNATDSSVKESTQENFENQNQSEGTTHKTENYGKKEPINAQKSSPSTASNQTLSQQKAQNESLSGNGMEHQESPQTPEFRNYDVNETDRQIDNPIIVSPPISNNSDNNRRDANNSIPFALSFSNFDTSICDGTSYKLRVKGNSFSRIEVWDNDIKVASLSKGEDIDLKNLSIGSHKLEFKAYSAIGKDFKTQLVNVVPSPKAEIQVQNWGDGKYIFILDTREPLKYSWFLDGLIFKEDKVWQKAFADTKVQEHAISAVFMNKFGCSDSLAKSFVNESIISLLEPKKRNFFSPNNDGYADEFILEVAGETFWHMSILDKSNKLIFESFDSRQGWNGLNQYNGQECAIGQYICVLEYQLTGGERQKMTWVITLSR